LLGRTSPSIGAGPCRALEGARTGPAIMRSVPRRPTWGERPSIGAGGGGTSAAFDRFRTISKKSRAEIAAGILDGGRSRCDPGAKYGEGRLAGSLASDPCNATLLICLESCATRGAIPAFRRWNDLRRENGEGCGILFVSSNKIGEDASRDASSLHHGGKVLRGEKVAVQLMLDWKGDGKTNGDFVVPRPWLNIIINQKLVTTRNARHGRNIVRLFPRPFWPSFPSSFSASIIRPDGIPRAKNPSWSDGKK